MTSLPSVPRKEARAVAKLVCVECGAPGEGSCGCGAPYVPPGQRAAEAVRQSPEKSDRAIAEEIGIAPNTVRAARKSTAQDCAVAPRIGRDGKIRKMPKRKIDPVKEQALAQAILDGGKTLEQAANEFADGSIQKAKIAVAREAGRREAKVDPDTLSLSAQEKLETAIRQEKRRLQVELEHTVQEELAKALNETVLPQYNKEKAEFRLVIESRKGLMTRATYRLILSCLHPDRVTDPELKERYVKAFRAFNDLELVLCSEKEMPTSAIPIPRTYEEMMKRRAEVKAQRRRMEQKQNVAQDR